MYRSSVYALVLASGCTLENNFADDLPVFGSSAPPPLAVARRTDRIVQVTIPQVDVLWMVDNSCSMSDEQSELTANFPFFMDYFLGSGLDYHVGVVSSDTISDRNGSKGKLVVESGLKYIEPSTPNPVELFIRMASLGTNGVFPERGLGATYLALEEKRDTENAGFYRDEAALHTIIISDEPDYTLASVITQPEYVDWYESLKPDVDKRTFSAIVHPNVGVRYRNTALAIGGIVWPLTAGDWPQVLELLGLQVAGLKREYFLSELPVLGTIEVSVEEATGTTLAFTEGVVDPVTGLFTDIDGDDLPDGDWSYNPERNSVNFREYVPTAGSTVELTYDRLAAAQGNDEIPSP